MFGVNVIFSIYVMLSIKKKIILYQVDGSQNNFVTSPPLQDVPKIFYGQVQIKQGQTRHLKKTFFGTQFEGNVVLIL